MAPGPDWTDVVQAVGTALSAVASVFLLYVAVRFRDEARLARNRPELRLVHDERIDGVVARGRNDTAHVYVRVQNTPGQDRAVGVGLELVAVEPRGATPPLPLPVPRRPFVVAERGDPELTEVDVPPNIARWFWVASLDVTRAVPEAQLALTPRSVTTRRDVLPIGEYDVTVAVTAVNTDATFWTLRLTLRPVLEGDQPSAALLRLGAPRAVDPR